MGIPGFIKFLAKNPQYDGVPSPATRPTFDSPERPVVAIDGTEMIFWCAKRGVRDVASLVKKMGEIVYEARLLAGRLVPTIFVAFSGELPRVRDGLREARRQAVRDPAFPAWFDPHAMVFGAEQYHEICDRFSRSLGSHVELSGPDARGEADTKIAEFLIARRTGICGAVLVGLGGDTVLNALALLADLPGKRVYAALKLNRWFGIVDATRLERQLWTKFGLLSPDRELFGLDIITLFRLVGGSGVLPPSPHLGTFERGVETVLAAYKRLKRDGHRSLFTRDVESRRPEPDMESVSALMTLCAENELESSAQHQDYATEAVELTEYARLIEWSMRHLCKLSVSDSWRPTSFFPSAPPPSRLSSVIATLTTNL